MQGVLQICQSSRGERGQLYHSLLDTRMKLTLHMLSRLLRILIQFSL